MSITCGAYRYGKTPCGRQSSQMAMGIIPLCKSHLETLQREMRVERSKGLQEAKDMYIGTKILEAREWREAAVVYFIKAGRRVKIGQSRTPERRLRNVRGGYSVKIPKGLDTSKAKLLATEPGGQVRENELHQKFAHLRVAGEWFQYTADLKEYISALEAAA